MKLHLIIKIIKNPFRAYSAIVRRAHVFFRKRYFWFCYVSDLIPRIINTQYTPYNALIPEQFKIRDESILKQAYHSLEKYGDFFGISIDDQLPPWHEDVRLRANNNPDRFFSYAWYSAIKIHPHCGNDLGPDIKVPWMLGRMNHVTVWAYAYNHTGDALFLGRCIEHLEDFLDKNVPYYGVQWTCTMEVALRSINIILTLSLIDDLPLALKQRLYISLRYHEWYIQNHWELYDGKTNNHYLSNLVGYWWLCSFFKSRKKLTWCALQLIQEVEKQQLHDGAWYEGSTAYHGLSTDLIGVALAIDKDDFLYSLKNTYTRMVEVDSFFKYDENKRILIGDNDSSPVQHPLLLRLMRQQRQSFSGTFSLPAFGLDGYKKHSLHVSLRHHVYNARQPSGHFHDDCNVITLAIHKTACIVDPGTYVYTSNILWRNKLRDVSTHGTCYLPAKKKQWPDCFANNLKVQEYHGAIAENADHIIFAAACSCRGFVHERFVHVNESKKLIKLTDYIKGSSENIIWQLPIRGIIVRSSETFIEFNTDGVIWQLQGQKKWCINYGSYAPSYGKLEPIIYVSLSPDNNQKSVETIITWR
jgi:hypothetical protein